jgi:hypothetical protein
VVASLSVRWGTLRSASEGVAIWIKSIPLIYAIPFAFSKEKRLRNLAISLALPAVASVVTILALNWPLGTAVTTLESTVDKGGQSMSALGAFFYLQTLGYAEWQGSLLNLLGYVWIPALVIATLLAYRWFGFATEKGLVQSLLLCTIAFMIFKVQVNEQYSIYLLALALIDVGIWNPSRRWIYIAITAVVMVYLLANNPELVRFLSPIDTNAVAVDGNLVSSWGDARFVVLFGSSLAFAALNIVYAALLYKDRGSKVRALASAPTA